MNKLNRLIKNNLSQLYLIGGVISSASIAYIVILLGGARAFVGPLTGAIIATGITISFNSYLRSEEKVANRKLLVNILIADLIIFYTSISMRIKAFEESQNPLGYVYITEEQFTIFTQNANKLGLFPQNITTEVIAVYFSIKDLFNAIYGISEENKKIQLTTNYLNRMDLSLNTDQLIQSAEYKGASAQYKIDTGIAEKNFGILINEQGPLTLRNIKKLIDMLSDLK